MQQFNLQQANVAVIGAGTMGIGIAQLAAMNGHQTLLFDLDLNTAKASLAQLTVQLNKRVQAGKITQALVDSTLANLIVVDDIQQLAAAGLIIGWCFKKYADIK
jgi:3-hydroxybutyryl-CoA dehydrogenase